MPQTFYHTPWPTQIPALISGILWLTTFVLLLTLGTGATVTAVFMVVALVSTLVVFLIEPGMLCYRGRLDDGTRVWIKRPIVGFKAHETIVGVTGGYEVSAVDGVRRERALIRI